ncbi:unnamed protein product [marine sediment metagenome]|uniref:Uncharacterized protein n=1 Tax=marine sediment metagenome TaxID=412755 RepID=X0W7H7_9ZZZZ
MSVLPAVLAAACGGGGELTLSIDSPSPGAVLSSSPFVVQGLASEAPKEAKVWLVVGGVEDGQYFGVNSVNIDPALRGDDGIAWQTQFYYSLCSPNFEPGERDVLLVESDLDLLNELAQALANQEPVDRELLREHVLASVMVDIQPDPAECEGEEETPQTEAEEP